MSKSCAETDILNIVSTEVNIKDMKPWWLSKILLEKQIAVLYP